MTRHLSCDLCGAVLGRHAPGKNCPWCLFSAGLADWGPADGPGAEERAGGALGRCGDYELLEEIGRGGMGVVYRARQVGRDRTVALKMMLAGPFAGRSELKRFHREADAAARLDHPNIVPIYEVGEHDGRAFFCMKFIGGGTLAEAMEQRPGPLPAAEAARFIIRIARTVHYAHERGFLHRDLKPGNILLDEQGEPHVIDFGLSRRVGNDGATTANGSVLGSPCYMAPEQALGTTRQLTPAADVYSLGVILYQLLSGRLPFRADTPLATLKLVVEKDPLRTILLDPWAAPHLEIICLQCLEKRPGDRYASAKALADDLERWLRSEPVQARRPSPWQRLRRWANRHPAWTPLANAAFHPDPLH